MWRIRAVLVIWQDSNLRHTNYEFAALPTELQIALVMGFEPTHLKSNSVLSQIELYQSRVKHLAYLRYTLLQTKRHQAGLTSQHSLQIIKYVELFHLLSVRLPNLATLSAELLPAQAKGLITAFRLVTPLT